MTKTHEDGVFFNVARERFEWKQGARKLSTFILYIKFKEFERKMVSRKFKGVKMENWGN